jgi:hypothetical protein
MEQELKLGIQITAECGHLNKDSPVKKLLCHISNTNTNMQRSLPGGVLGHSGQGGFGSENEKSQIFSNITFKP